MQFARVWPIALLMLAATSRAQETSAVPIAATAEKKVDFLRDIQPIFAKRCFSCHGPDKAEGGLRLNRREAALAELESGEHAVVPGQPDKSAMLARVSSDDESVRMPPEGSPLTAAQVELIRRWIAQDAPWELHWAFQPPRPQTPPAVQNSGWARTPLDAFVLARLEQHGLRPAAQADKTVLLRRAYYGLTGLPPTPEEADAFLADTSDGAFEKVVDRLLDSTHYGEQWARHWLDLVRYAETNSFERDGVKPNAWRYRDYVIRSFNADKPYDQFIREQLAGDELETVSNDSIIATGYYRLGLWDDEPSDPLQARYDELDDIVATTGQVFLGLTINCARCHDHKIDPIPQADYYRLLSFFHALRPYGTRADQKSFNQTDISAPKLRAKHERLESAISELREPVTQIEERAIAKMPGEDQRKAETRERKKLLQEKLQQHLSDEDWREYSSLKSRLDSLQAEQKDLPPREMALSIARSFETAPPTHVLVRGNAHLPGDLVVPGFPRIFDAPDPVFATDAEDSPAAGRRLTLARWIGSPDNMLTARVLVNRVWQHHFGRGIVRSPNNFGQLGEPPTHPELLDWLAAEFIRQGWRLKPLHRLIMSSSAYQMSSRANPDALAKDPRNDLFWRFDMRRLSAEELRDSIHAVTGKLNPKMYGPGFYPEISQEVLAGQSRPGEGWGKSSPEEQARRSIYIHVKRSLITPVLASFDFPDPDGSCDARFATTQPSQALAMLNGDFVNRQAVEFAKRLRFDAGTDTANQVRRALRLALCRNPEPKEVERGVALLARLQREHGVSAEAALDYYCLLVVNLNEFVYLD